MAGRLEVGYDAQKLDGARLVSAVKSISLQVGETNVKIGTENLHCASCMKFIEDELKYTRGVLYATLDIPTQETSIDYLPEKATLSQLNAAIETWDYKPRPPTTDALLDK